MIFSFPLGSSRISFCLLFLTIILPLAPMHYALAQMVFERANVTITHTQTAEEAKTNTVMLAPVTYSVELRHEDALYLENMLSLSTLKPQSGVLISLDYPGIVTLPAYKVYTPVDVLFVAKNGQVTEIIPSIVLGEQTKETVSKNPSKALLFLKSGEATTNVIRVGDVVSGRMF